MQRKKNDDAALEALKMFIETSNNGLPLPPSFVDNYFKYQGRDVPHIVTTSSNFSFTADGKSFLAGDVKTPDEAVAGEYVIQRGNNYVLAGHRNAFFDAIVQAADAADAAVKMHKDAADVKPVMQVRK